MLMVDEIKTYQSRNWDMDISLKELIDYSTYCYVDRKYKKLNSHNDCGAYDGICIYLKHPNNDKYSLMIGISEDGFVYVADSTPTIEECEKSWSLQVIMEMYYYGHYLESKENNKRMNEILNNMTTLEM